MAYPTSIDTFSTKVNGVDTVDAADVNGLQTAVVAIETALGTSPAGTQRATVGATVRSLRPKLNLKTDFGAAGDGSTDDTEAVAAFSAAAEDMAISTSAGSGLMPATMYVPPGVYRITDPAALFDSPRTGTAATLRGPKMVGEGRRVSEFLFDSPAGAPTNPWDNALMVLANRWRGASIGGISFRSTNPNQTFAYLFCSADNDGTVEADFGSGAQNDIVWEDVELRGEWHRGWVMDGDTQANQNSEQVWKRCAASNEATFSDAVIRTGGLRAFPASQQTDQFCNYTLDHCNWEYRDGDLFVADAGGHIHMIGGSVIIGVGASAGQGGRAFVMGDISPESHAYNTKHLTVRDTRFEARTTAFQLIDTYWNGSSAHMTFDGISIANDQIGAGTTAQKILARANHTVATFRAGSNPGNVRFVQCELPGHIVVTTSGTPSGGRLVLDQTNFRENQAGGFATTATGLATSVSGSAANGTAIRYSGGSAPKYRYRDCYGIADAAN